MIIEVESEIETKALGERLAGLFEGGEVVELIGDIGSGKTALAKGIATGLRVDDDVQSPSFTLSRIYPARDGLVLAHYDFYRLNDAGLLSIELAEVLREAKTVLVIEWAAIVSGVLPDDRISVSITSTGDTVRKVHLTAGGTRSKSILEKLQ